jgi:CHAT domain-containing protein
MLDSNLSSLYLDSGDLDSSLECAERALRGPPEITLKLKPKLLLQCARVKREQKDDVQAAAMLKDALEASEASVDTPSESQAWNELGILMLEHDRLPAAELALLQAFRLRKLTGDDHLHYTYESLANLRLLEGDFKSADTLFDRAVDSAKAAGAEAMWKAYYSRGKGKLGRPQNRQAFSDFNMALKLARLARAEVLPADSFRIGKEVELQSVYSAFIEAGNLLYTQTHRKRYAELTFSAAEEIRAASLRALWLGPDLTKKLPNHYWESLAKFKAAELALVKGEPQDAAASVRQLHLEMTEMETRAGLDFTTDRDVFSAPKQTLVDRAKRALQSNEVFFGFHLGEVDACLWVVTREGFGLYRLPTRVQLEASVAAFVKGVRANSPEASVAGGRLYSQLFGSVDPRLLSRPVWIIAPDGPLFELPFSALVADNTSQRSYLIEKKIIRLVPGISAILEHPAPILKGPAVALGDPIYNDADPRLTHTAGAVQVSSRTSMGPFQLARLPASSREIEHCARTWRSHGYETILLKGADANPRNLTRVLQLNPAVLHIATHILFPPLPQAPGSIALALGASGDVDVLSAADIANVRSNIGVVVLNGCSSAQAEALPGAGLMGLTRAWLAAGARAVIATRWAISDQESEEFVESLYDSLSGSLSEFNHVSFCQLLQRAQAMAARNGRRCSTPSCWAAYFCVERS